MNNQSDRMAMFFEARNALTAGDCTTGLVYAEELYESQYSDNDIRMLYASAHACNVGIVLATLLDSISTADFTSADAIFKTLVRLFPSKAATDTRLQSATYAQDALQGIFNLGAVVGSPQGFYLGTSNPGSIRTADRTDDANIFLAFTSMSAVGTALNRFGFNASDDPNAFAYAQQVNLTWTTEAAVTADTTGQACALSSALLNMIDGIDVLSVIAPGSVSTALSGITSNLSAGLDASAHAVCNPAYNASICDTALERLRFRGSCAESGPAAASAAGIIGSINLGWL